MCPLNSCRNIVHLNGGLRKVSVNPTRSIDYPGRYLIESIQGSQPASHPAGRVARYGKGWPEGLAEEGLTEEK